MTTPRHKQHTIATVLLAVSARPACGNGLFHWKEKRRNSGKQGLQCRGAGSKGKTAPACSMRLARANGLGRRMDAAGWGWGCGPVAAAWVEV